MRKSNKGKPRPKPDHHSRNVAPGKATGIKPTASEVNNRIQQCVELLALRRTRSEITDAMCRQYGISWQTVSNYLNRARQFMMDRAARPKKDFVADAVGLYENVIKALDATKRDRLAAQMGLNNLLGLDAPKQVHTQLSGPAGGKIEIEQKVKQDFDHDGYRAAFRAILSPVAENGNREPVHSARPDAEAGGVSGGNGK